MNITSNRLTRSLMASGMGIVAVGGALVGIAATSSPASAGPDAKHVAVVQVVDRAPIGRMLATRAGASLYTTSGTCTGGCLTVWPPLVMPKGVTKPIGVKGLSTVEVTIGTHHKLQVAYHGKPLYTFEGDSGTSVNGNGVGGFVAATVG